MVGNIKTHQNFLTIQAEGGSAVAPRKSIEIVFVPNGRWVLIDIFVK